MDERVNGKLERVAILLWNGKLDSFVVRKTVQARLR